MSTVVARPCALDDLAIWAYIADASRYTAYRTTPPSDTPLHFN
jgi:hypothetical protein